MIRSKVLILLALFLLNPIVSIGQDYDIELTADKKIIHVQQLSLPGNMALIDYLLNIPELTDRNADTFLARYDIKYDGKIVTESKDAILANTLLCDIQKIEISNSPSDAHVKNGVAGSINIVPIPFKEGFRGDAGVQGSFLTGVMPSLNMYYSDGKKVDVRANLDFDIYCPTKLTSKEIISKEYNEFTYDTSKVRYAEQLARIYAKWKISDKDELKVWFIQSSFFGKSYNNSSTTRIDDMSKQAGEGWLYKTVSYDSSVPQLKNLSFATFLEYKRTLKPGDFSFNIDYRYNNNYKIIKDDLNAELKSVSNFDLKKGKLKFQVSVNTSLNSNRSFQNRMFYVSPMLRLEYSSEKVKAVVNGRYKGYARNYQPQGYNQFKGWSQDWTSEANVLWQMADHHALRLKLSRNAGAASNELVYPEFVYNEGDKTWIKGNPDLMGPVTSDFDLKYITDWSNGPHALIFEFSAEYNLQERMIEYNILHDTAKGIVYQYPVNLNNGDVISLTSMLNYSYGFFSMSFGGNLFYNMKNARFQNLKATYYNIQFTPSVQLKKNWLISAVYLYNSKVYKEFGTLGDFSVLDLRVSKKIANWTLFAAFRDVFNYSATDLEFDSSFVTKTTYDPYMRSFDIGAKIFF